jgi:hypothetical protein
MHVVVLGGDGRVFGFGWCHIDVSFQRCQVEENLAPKFRTNRRTIHWKGKEPVTFPSNEPPSKFVV